MERSIPETTAVAERPALENEASTYRDTGYYVVLIALLAGAGLYAGFAVPTFLGILSGSLG